METPVYKPLHCLPTHHTISASSPCLPGSHGPSLPPPGTYMSDAMKTVMKIQSHTLTALGITSLFQNQTLGINIFLLVTYKITEHLAMGRGFPKNYVAHPLLGLPRCQILFHIIPFPRPFWTGPSARPSPPASSGTGAAWVKSLIFSYWLLPAQAPLSFPTKILLVPVSPPTYLPTSLFVSFKYLKMKAYTWCPVSSTSAFCCGLAYLRFLFKVFPLYLQSPILPHCTVILPDLQARDRAQATPERHANLVVLNSTMSLHLKLGIA